MANNYTQKVGHNRESRKIGCDSRISHLVIESVDIAELASSRDQASLRSPLSERHRANNPVIRWRNLRNTEANRNRTLLNTCASKINRNQLIGSKLSALYGNAHLD